MSQRDRELELLRAYEARDRDRIRAALAEGASPDARWVMAALAEGERPDVSSIVGEPLLAMAIKAGAFKIALDLVAAGANPNATSQSGWPALTLAVMIESEELPPALIAAGASVSAQNQEGLTALMAAAGGWAGLSGPRATRVLLRAGAQTEQIDNSGATALALAARLGRLEEMSVLIAGGADTMRGREDPGSPWGEAKGSKSGGGADAMGLLASVWEAEDLAKELGRPNERAAPLRM